MLARIARSWAWLENTLVVLILACMLVSAIVQVGLRNGFDSGIAWVEAFQQYALLWLAFLGASIASRERKHISIDAFLLLLPERFRKMSRWLPALFAAGVCAVAGWCCWLLVVYEQESGEMAFGSVPLWWCLTIMPVSFGVMALRSLTTLWMPPAGEG